MLLAWTFWLKQTEKDVMTHWGPLEGGKLLCPVAQINTVNSLFRLFMIYCSKKRGHVQNCCCLVDSFMCYCGVIV